MITNLRMELFEALLHSRFPAAAPGSAMDIALSLISNSADTRDRGQITA